MKKIFTSAALSLLVLTSFGQQASPSLSLTQQEYLEKSQWQKAGGWLTTGLGGAIGIGSYLSTAGVYINEPRPPFPTVGVGIGSTLVAGGISFLVASARNKKKARAATALLRAQKVPSFYPAAYSPAYSGKVCF